MSSYFQTLARTEPPTTDYNFNEHARPYTGRHVVGGGVRGTQTGGGDAFLGAQQQRGGVKLRKATGMRDPSTRKLFRRNDDVDDSIHDENFDYLPNNMNNNDTHIRHEPPYSNSHLDNNRFDHGTTIASSIPSSSSYAPPATLSLASAIPSSSPLTTRPSSLQQEQQQQFDSPRHHPAGGYAHSPAPKGLFAPRPKEPTLQDRVQKGFESFVSDLLIPPTRTASGPTRASTPAHPQPGSSSTSSSASSFLASPRPPPAAASSIPPSFYPVSSTPRDKNSSSLAPLPQPFSPMETTMLGRAPPASPVRDLAAGRLDAPPPPPTQSLGDAWARR